MHATPVTDRDAPAGLTVGRLVRTLARQWFVIPACVVVAVAGSFAYAKVAPSHYTAAIGVDLGTPPSTSASASSATPTGSVGLPDPSAEVSSVSVLRAAAAAAHTSPEAISLSISYAASAVNSSSLGPTGNAVIQATALTPEAAEEAAAAAGPAFVAQRTADLRGEVTIQAQQLDQIQSRLQALQSGKQPSGSIGSQTFNPSGPVSAQIAVVNSLYQSLYGSTVQLQVLASSVGVTQSVTAAQRVGLSTSRRAAEAAAVGLLVGIGLVLLRDRLMDRATDPFEIRELSSVPVLGYLPKLRGRPSTLPEGSEPWQAESYRSIRTSLQLQAPGRQKVFVVVSAGRQEGRTSVATNLAASFARTGASTLLLDADFRHPDAATRFGIAEGREGLADVLGSGSGQAEPGAQLEGGSSIPEGVLAATGLPTLQVLPAGRVGPASPELFGAEELEKLEWALRQRFEFIVVDTPAITEVSDAMALSSHADGCIFVFARNRSTKAGVSKSIAALRHTSAPVLGIVVTRKGRPRVARSSERGRSHRPRDDSDRSALHARRHRRHQ